MTKLSRSECTVDIGGNVSLCDLHGDNGDKPCCQVYLRDNKQACYKEDFTLAGKIKNQNKKNREQLFAAVSRLFLCLRLFSKGQEIFKNKLFVNKPAY